MEISPGPDAGVDAFIGVSTQLAQAGYSRRPSVAAVALPVAIAYAELAGVSPVVGLYSCILPMVAYALFGSSRQLIVGPTPPPVR